MIRICGAEYWEKGSMGGRVGKGGRERIHLRYTEGPSEVFGLVLILVLTCERKLF